MVFTENIEYGLNNGVQELPGFDDQYMNIVDYILKITEEIWEKRAVWVIHDTYDKNIPIHTGAGTTYGVDEVVKGTLKTLSSFPDRKMKGEAVIWSKVDDNHFYSSHRIGSTATNLGKTEFGKATGKKVFFRTIADCLVSENKIIEEWLVRDNLHLVMQLGFDPVEMAKKNERYSGAKKKSPNNSLELKYEKPAKNDIPKSTCELIISLFENIWNKRNFDEITKYYKNFATVHAICEEDLIGIRLIKKYLQYLLNSFPDANVDVERITCNKKAGLSEVAVRWKIIGKHTGNGFFSPASGKEIILPGISHFIIKDGKIAEEWMVFDGFDVLCQIYSDDNMEESFSSNGAEDIHLINKKLVARFIEELNDMLGSEKNFDKVFEKYLSDDIALNITKPFEKIKGIKNYSDKFWSPLLDSFPDMEIQPYILIGGEYEGRNNVSLTGNFIGTFKNDWLDIPATDQPTWIRFAAHFILRNNKITHAWYFLDILDVMRQAGFNYFPCKGIQHVPPAPMTGNGIVLYQTDKKEGQKTLDLTNTMLNGLGSYDGKSLESMGQERFWDVQNMMWYGPSGIGTTRGLKGFQENHQLPFLIGFPDRGITPKKGKIYFAQIGDGNYSCDFGFPAMYGTHNGDGWLGLKATNKEITLRVVDYWRREGDKLKENWVLIDLVDVLEQLGVDVFNLMKKEIKKRKNAK